jgi:hypothetical protein
MSVSLLDVEGVPIELVVTRLSCRLYVSKQNKINILDCVHCSTPRTDTFYDTGATTKQMLSFLRCRDGVYELRMLDLSSGVYVDSGVVVPEHQRRVLVKYSFTRHDLRVDDIIPQLDLVDSSLPFDLSVYLDEITSDPGYSTICVKAVLHAAPATNQDNGAIAVARKTISAVCKGLAAEFGLPLCPGYSKFMYMMRIFNDEVYATRYMPHDLVHSAMYSFMEGKIAQGKDPQIKSFLFDMLMPPEQFQSDGEFVDWTTLAKYRDAVIHAKKLSIGLPDKCDFYYDHYLN